MVKLRNKGDTLLAKHLDGHARKIVWKGERIHPVMNKRMVLYECDRNTKVQIIQAYTGQLPIGAEGYHKEVGDELEGDAISIYVDSIRREKFEVKEGVSGTHGGQIIKFRKMSVSTIKVPLDNLRKMIAEKIALLENKKEN